MVMAVGLHGPASAMYHLATHAFFKALLFLGAGSVIHALHHEQNIWNMGGLKARMPVTYWTFLIGTLALAGVPPFSGFFSKDEILAAAYDHNLSLFVVAVFAAFLTTLYMFRLVFVAFGGGMKSEAPEAAHESPKVMTLPLAVLAVPSIFAGFWGIDTLFEHQFGAKQAEQAGSILNQLFAPLNHSPAAALAGLGAILFGFSLAWTLYAGAKADPLPEKLGKLARGMRNRFYCDEIYEGLIAVTQEFLAAVAEFVDRWIIAGLLVRGSHGTTEIFGRALRLLQTGNLQTYAFLFVAGVALVLFFALSH
jgi:NADH-quinone oxidoreductase subunit L